MSSFDIRILDLMKRRAEELRDTRIQQIVLGEKDFAAYRESVGFLQALDALVLGENSEAAHLRKQILEG